MNQVATSAPAGGAIASLANLKAGLQNVHAAIPRAGGEPILRMGRDGVWIYGAENMEVQPGSIWAANPHSLIHGFVCWKKLPEGSKEAPELLGQELVSMYTPLPVKSALPDLGHPWTACVGINFKCTNLEDEGEQVIYKPNSTGGLNAMGELVASVMSQADKDPANIVPLIRLDNDHYQHPTWGKTYVPILTLMGWTGMDVADAGTAAPAPAETAPQPEPEPAPAPQPTRRRAAPQPTFQADPKTAEVTRQYNQAAAQAAQTAPAGQVGERRRRRA